MSRLSKRILLPIIITVAGVMSISIFLNSFFIQRYTLAQQKSLLNEVSKEAIGLSSASKEAFDELERNYNVTIITFDFIEYEDQFNDILRSRLQTRGIGFIELWLWTNGLNILQEKGSITQLYNQGRLQYSILVKYTLHENQVYAVVMNVPHSSQTLKNVNQVTLLVFGLGGIMLLVLVILIVKKVTRPVVELTKMAQLLSEQKFCTIQVNSKDEIGTLAVGFNNMSNALQKAQLELKDKNTAMEELLSNVSHEVKTPVALIKAYGTGIKDGLDDGTFLDEILLQNERIGQMIEGLLKISRIKKSVAETSDISLSDMLTSLADAYGVMFKQEQMELFLNIQANISIKAEKDDISTILNNLLSNAFKYAKSHIWLSLDLDKEYPVFRVSNDLLPDSSLDTDRIWEPFYVGESSRSKELSGTGLGLPLVRAILEKYEYTFQCKVEDGHFIFLIQFR